MPYAAEHRMPNEAPLKSECMMMKSHEKLFRIISALDGEAAGQVDSQHKRKPTHHINYFSVLSHNWQFTEACSPREPYALA